jgi:hypothetical protein
MRKLGPTQLIVLRHCDPVGEFSEGHYRAQTARRLNELGLVKRLPGPYRFAINDAGRKHLEAQTHEASGA